MRYLYTILLFFAFQTLIAAPNCELYPEGSKAREACDLCMKAISYAQGSPLSQEYFDKAMEVDPTFAYAPYEKAVPFLKRGQFRQWRELIDVAVDLEPIAYLPYRGWCIFKFMRDYETALTDLEEYMHISDGTFTYSQDGSTDLRIVIALCKRELGRVDEAIEDMEKAIADSKANHFVGLHDYFYLGITKLKAGDYTGAIQALELEIGEYEKLADNYYYLGLAHEKSGNTEKALEYYQHSLELFQGAGYSFDDIYTESLDRVYEADVLSRLKELK